MSTYLLDTHTFVWSVAAPEQLGPTARAVIEDPASTLLVSAASAWEVATKVRVGRWPDAASINDRFGELITRLRATELPVTVGHALRAGALRWDHRDPFDRMLAAQSFIEFAPLVSRDRAFTELAGLELVW